MSGVGITGLIKPLNSGAFPVWEDIDGLGGFRTVADITARNAIYANERKLGMQVKTQSDGNTWTLVGGILDANWQLEQGQAPFQARYYVNPGFTGGIKTGSSSNPFTTIAAAMAYAVSLGIVNYQIRIPFGVTVTENVVFPPTGGLVEIIGEGFSSTSVGSRITGSITMNCTSGGLRSKLTNLIITGNITGNANVGFIFYQATAVRQNGSITLTITNPLTDIVETCFRGIGAPTASKQCGSNTQLVSVSGIINADNWVFEGGFNEYSIDSFTPYPGSQFQSCWFGSTSGSPIPIGLNAKTLNCAFYDCVFVGPTTFTASISNYVINIDGASLASLNHPIAGIILVGTNLQVQTINANRSSRLTLTNNVASTPFGGRNPDGIYEVVFDQTLLVAGTAGVLQLNVIYTDMTGTLVTVPVGGTLNITSAVGTKNSGSLVFRHNGAAAPIAFSYTGIVTPGAMSVAGSAALMLRS